MENKESKWMSWNRIILLLVLFWPVGFYLLYKKVSLDKSTVLKNSKTVKIIGIIFIVLGVVYFFDQMAEGSNAKGSPVGGMLFLVIGGVFMIYTSKKLQLQGEKFKKYISIVINNNETSIDNIASAMNVSYEEAINDLKIMIDKGYFLNAYVDLGSREFVIRKKQYEPINVKKNSSVNEVKEEKPKMKVVVCKNCGGNNTILEGEISECEFCGSPLS